MYISIETVCNITRFDYIHDIRDLVSYDIKFITAYNWNLIMQ